MVICAILRRCRAPSSQVRESYAAPVDAYAINVMGTVHLLDAVRSVDSVRTVVIVTSDKCYENWETHLGYREDAPIGGYDPYSSSRGCAELVTAAYRNSFFHPAKYAEHGVAVASGRSGNVIGGGDWAKDRLIPDILRAFDAGRPVQIRYPQAIRPWQHVLEPLKGYLMLAERLVAGGPDIGEGWNFGPATEDAKSDEWIVERLARTWGGSASWARDTALAPHEANVLTLDAAKARARLGWQPRWTLHWTGPWPGTGRGLPTTTCTVFR